MVTLNRFSRFISALFFKQTKKIEYVKSPTFREKKYPCEASPQFEKEGLLKDCGKKLPLVDRLVVNIIEEDQPRWLNFQKGKVEYKGFS